MYSLVIYCLFVLCIYLPFMVNYKDFHIHLLHVTTDMTTCVAEADTCNSNLLDDNNLISNEM